MQRRTHPYVDLDEPMVLAHRGDSLHAPANTLPAFQLAVNAGVEALETDVHWTKDGVIVVCHDETVDATSNGHGAIEDYTYEELTRLDFGYWFSTDAGKTFPFRGMGITIPTLQSVLHAFPTVRVNIDIKTSRPHSMRQFVDEVYGCNAEKRVLAASFHDSVLKQFRSMNSEIATSASTRETAEFCLRVWLRRAAPTHVPYCALQVPLKHRGISVVSERLIALAHDAGVKVHVWTIDDPKVMKTLLAMGVDGIVSNDPSIAVRVRDTFVESASD